MGLVGSRGVGVEEELKDREGVGGMMGRATELEERTLLGWEGMMGAVVAVASCCCCCFRADGACGSRMGDYDSGD